MTNRPETKQLLVDSGELGVVFTESAEKLIKVAKALHDGGVNCIELAMTTPNALSVMKVVDLNMSEIEELYDIRELFEIHALNLSMPYIDDDDLHDLREETINILEEDVPQEELRRRFDVTDKRLHWELIIGNSGSHYLQKFSKNIYDFVYFARQFVERITDALEEHLLIIDSLLDRDSEDVKAALRKHFENHLHSLRKKDFDYASQLFNEKKKVESQLAFLNNAL